MKNTNVLTLFAIVILLNSNPIFAQDSSSSCKVNVSSIGTWYKGECKNGLASGQGEAGGVYRYKGAFKLGKPDGYGTYYYADSNYYQGFFQDNLKEGKGEEHFIRKDGSDSVVKGYWSANVFRSAKKYITYDFDGLGKIDRSDITATPEIGRTISFEITTTSGSPTGVPSDFQGQPGYVLRLDDLTTSSDVILRQLSSVDTPTRSVVTYDISAFPVILYGKLSNGDNFKLELFKAAKWRVKFFLNK